MDPKGAKMVKGALFKESLLATVPELSKETPIAACKAVILGHFIRQNHNLAAKFVSFLRTLVNPYSIKKWVSFWSLFQTQVLKNFLDSADEKKQLSLPVANSNRPKLLWYMSTILYLPSRKSASNTIDDRNHKCIYEVASDNGMGRMERDGNPILPLGNIAILP